MKKVFYLLLSVLFLLPSCTDSDNKDEVLPEPKMAEYEVLLKFADVPAEDYANKIAVPIFIYFDNSEVDKGKYVEHTSDGEWLYENRIQGENLFTTMYYFKEAKLKGKADRFHLTIEMNSNGVIEIEKATKLSVSVKKDGVVVKEQTIDVAKFPEVSFEVEY